MKRNEFFTNKFPRSNNYKMFLKVKMTASDPNFIKNELLYNKCRSRIHALAKLGLLVTIAR